MQLDYEVVAVENLFASVCAHRFIVLRRAVADTDREVAETWARKTEQINESSE